MRVDVRCHGIRGQVFFQGDDPRGKAGLCSGCPAYGCLDRQDSRFHWSMPFGPYDLGASCRHDNVVHGIAPAVYMEGNTGRVVRVDLPAAGQGNAGDDIRIHAVGIVRGLQFSGRDFLISHDADTEGGQDLRIRYLSAGRSAPCRVAQVRGFQKNGKGQVLVCKAGQFAAQGSPGHLVIQGCFCSSHGIIAAAVGKVGDGLYDQLVGAGDQLLKCNPCFGGNELCRVLRTEIAPDRLDACFGRGAADDAGQRRRRPGAGIGASRREGSAGGILELAYMPEVDGGIGDAGVGQVKGGGDHAPAGGDYGDAYPILAVPDICFGAAAHPAATAVDVPFPGSQYGHAGG